MGGPARGGPLARMFPVPLGATKQRGWIQLALVTVVIVAFAVVLLTGHVSGGLWITVAFVLALSIGIVISSIRLIRHGH
ncbi:hypothetical protein [Herbiconiux daphne]|uniref:Uncharacterized protein n=1 Tax=Herbiconiux daphne TaxID=2970914 RepID=A0ABT2GWG5_9MICO|nr:hypothetical protein [Herbiconiux daphne]MCS5732309.1 hypothetical protein [Herbiconiux daphne]